MVRPDPFPAESCGRQQCRTVKKAIDGKCENTCWQQHTNYSVFCKSCEERRGEGEKKHVYIGESSRGCYSRFNQEKEEYDLQKGGFMYKHAQACHEGSKDVEFIIKRESIDKDPMRRIIRESVRIEKALTDKSIEMMNTREEHFGPQTVRSRYGIEWMQNSQM